MWIARAITRTNEPSGFVKSLVNMARWSSKLDYSNLDALIATIRATNALEESPAAYKLLNVDGSVQTRSQISALQTPPLK